MLPHRLFLVVPDPMKLGDWVTWTNGTSAGQVTAFTRPMGGRGVVVQVRVTATHPNKLSDTVYTMPYLYEDLKVVPEAVAKIINS